MGMLEAMSWPSQLKMLPRVGFSILMLLTCFCEEATASQ
jgi:hypothetical protein